MFRKTIDKVKKDLMTGMYTLLVLLILDRKGPSYGFEIMKIIREKSHNMFAPSDSTIYNILHGLEKQGYVSSYWAEAVSGPPRRYYEITEKGRELLKEMMYLTKEIYDLISRIGGDRAC
ncbi:MAG: PadR family transcriptional regulator [Thermoprotei archaeon]|nr:MAG: PadR family transcriptional regulator [Thermoprotei archaeon]RLF25722.1 MAG: PadR family transcriptional regulator [Thermoprotei archaeon]